MAHKAYAGQDQKGGARVAHFRREGPATAVRGQRTSSKTGTHRRIGRVQDEA